MINKNNIHNLLPSFGCITCGEGYKKESVDVVRQEDGLLVVKIKCISCEKSFGAAFLGLELEELSKALCDGKKQGERLGPISYDDVIDAHRYFKDADENWKKFITSEKR